MNQLVSKATESQKKGEKMCENPLVKQTNDKLYSERNETGDVTFIVNSESIRAHRCILAALSPKYKAQFYGGMPEKGDIIVKDVSVPAFMEFLQFFYLEKVTLTMENIEAVLHLASQSLVDAFVNKCAEFLMEMTTVDNLCPNYQLAVLHDIKPFEDFCKQKICEKASEVFKTSDFTECDYNFLRRILGWDSLRCKETEVFDACIAWAKVACERKNVDAMNASNLRTELGNAVFEIRFSSMTLEEFSPRHKSHMGLFSLDEINDIVCVLGKIEIFESRMFSRKPRISEHGVANTYFYSEPSPRQILHAVRPYSQKKSYTFLKESI